MESDSSGDVPVTPRRRRWPLVLALAVVTPLAVLALFWFGLPPQVLREPVHLVRGADGKLAPEDGAPKRQGVSLEVYAGKLAANDSMTSACVTSSGDRVCFPCAALAVFNRSEHVFMLRLGKRLIELLKELPYVERIDYYPPGFAPDEGARAPDVAIALELSDLQESALVWDRKFEAAVTVTAGTRLAASNAAYHDSLSPPLLEFAWQGRLQHRSTTTGVASSGARYKQVAEHCAKQVADALRKQFDASREKYPPLPKLPEAFYPPYRGPVAMPLGEAHPLERLAAWHGLMNHCDATWRLATDRDPAELLGDMRKRLETAGWKVGDSSNRPELRYLRMKRDSVVLEIFPEGQGGIRMQPPTVEGPAASQPREQVVYIHYLDRMTEKELAAAVERSMAGGSPLEALVLFERSWTEDQCRQILTKSEGVRPKDADGWLTAARLHQRLRQLPQARDAVIKAHATERTSPDTSGLSGRIQQMAKTLGDESLAKRPADVGLLKELGFVELKPGATIPDRELAAEEPACFLATDRNGKLRTLAVRVKSLSPSAGSMPQLSFVDWADGSRSWGSGGNGHTWQIDGVGTVRITANALPNPKRFRLSVRMTPPPPAAPKAAKR